jgi:hypothetical protein
MDTLTKSYTDKQYKSDVFFVTKDSKIYLKYLFENIIEYSTIGEKNN